MTRREARVFAMQILYTAELSKISLQEAAEIFNDDDKVIEARANEKKEKSADYMDFINLCIGKEQEINQIIASNLFNYSIDRLNAVDRAIIRLATAELLAGAKPTSVINEALEITKEFSDQGDHKAVGFNNRVLDNIAKSLKK